MQDIHAIGGGGDGGGRFFGGGDRRMRPHSHPNNHLQALKCPRCDSLNTKFCYYNNYNLSQPRHFCKSCRRYWTKGGVLRNVPVGGGCRKTKRGNQKSGEGSGEHAVKAQSSSSTESSSKTAAAMAAATVPEEPPTVSNSASIASIGAVYNFSDSKFFPSFDNQSALLNPPTDAQIFPSAFAGLIPAPPSSSPEMMGFGMVRAQADFGAPASHNPHPLTSEVEAFELLPHMKTTVNDGRLTAPDWETPTGGGDHALFDLTADVDPVYWTQPQWTDSDHQHSLNFLP
ncbi:hypothetical protein M569_08452 [Genlisea aurea]|uniref:Dof zinc finger protein n=1 Tax=Genlisea aurea TaxID=192259 RepID=S8CHK7_9LAMI|nr:hypothetical protein M569_08452 [Genlisea aurea]